MIWPIANADRLIARCLLLPLLLAASPLNGQDLSKVEATHAAVARESSGALKLRNIGAAEAQSKPNFSGTWKMNPEKSKLRPDNNPSKLINVVVKIDHKGSNLSKSMIVSRSDGDQTAEGIYAIDGKESDVRLPFGVVKGTAKWEGDELVIEWRNERERFHVLWKYALSADGQTITLRSRDLHDPNQKDDYEIMALEKQ